MIVVASATVDALALGSDSTAESEDTATPKPYGTSTSAIGHADLRFPETQIKAAVVPTNAAGTRCRNDGTVWCFFITRNL